MKYFICQVILFFFLSICYANYEEYQGGVEAEIKMSDQYVYGEPIGFYLYIKNKGNKPQNLLAP